MPCRSFSTRTRCAISSASGSVAVEVARSALKKPMAHANGSGRKGWTLKQLKGGICLVSHAISAAAATALVLCCCCCCCSTRALAGSDVAAWLSLMIAPRANICANNNVGSPSLCVGFAARTFMRIFVAAARCFSRGQKSLLEVPSRSVVLDRR